MNKNLTDITLVVDRSGSMASCRQEAQSGINAFIEDQKKCTGDAVFSLLQFDTEYEYVYNGVKIGDVGNFTLNPRGMTALLDAVGKAITETGVRLEKMNEEDRPGLVVIAIITDGQENSSHEYTRAVIKDMITRQQTVYNWQFTFLGANIDAFAEAGSLGITASATSVYTTANANVAYMSASANTTRMRNAVSTGTTVQNSYTDDERKGMVN